MDLRFIYLVKIVNEKGNCAVGSKYARKRWQKIKARLKMFGLFYVMILVKE